MKKLLFFVDGWGKTCGEQVLGRDEGRGGKLVYFSQIGSMGLVYLSTFTNNNQPNVGKYTILGSYGIG